MSSVNTTKQIQRDTREIWEVLCVSPLDGHDDIIGQGLGDSGESGADDGTNGQCHGVAFDGKGYEFIPPGGLFYRVFHIFVLLLLGGH